VGAMPPVELRDFWYWRSSVLCDGDAEGSYDS
jgi:hypothetical protein